MMPLNLADPGVESVIKKVGGSSEVKQHLENLGFVAGAKVSLISKNAGNIIVQIKDSRVAVSREMAQKIFV